MNAITKAGTKASRRSVLGATLGAFTFGFHIPKAGAQTAPAAGPTRPR